MLLPEQVVPFLQHDDPLVRDHVGRYFRDSYDFGPLTAEHYWAVIDHLGENSHTSGFAAGLGHLPQTDASLRRLVGALAANPSENFEFHYQHAIREMELEVLARNREELLACPQLLPHVRKQLELRLSLLDTSPGDAWDRLMQHGRELGDEYAGNFDAGPGDALIEAAARGGAPVCEQAMIAVADPMTAEDWREIFAVQVLGLAHHDSAIDALVEKLAVDADVLREEVNRALSRIATPRVIERILGFYPGKPWHVRLYTHSALANIKTPHSEEALLKLLEVELALGADRDYDDEGEPLMDALLHDLTELGSLAGLDESRRFISGFPDDPERLDLCQSLIATAVMTGVTLPEETSWRELLKRRDNRMAGRRFAGDAMLATIRDRWRETGRSFSSGDDTQDELPDESDVNGPIPAGTYSDRLEPIRNVAPKIGRNAPCPCGSGKKYKKCCGK
jgi:hypothetical protein